MPIEIKNLNYIYMKGTPFEKVALKDINLTIQDGEFTAIIGHTGSGKSTLIQNLNGLLKPTSGEIIVDEINITQKKVDLNAVRKKVGLVFQYPEYQLFEETVEKDVAFGPKKLGLSEEEIKNRVVMAMDTVGLSYEKYGTVSPFELSGGQKRRAAIAGVIAMQPKILILDEPTAGLDPKGRDDLLERIKEFHTKYNMTILFVSHSMEDVAKIAHRVIVMNEGKCVLDGQPKEIFKEAVMLEKIGLGVPQITYMIKELRDRGFNLPEGIFTIEQAKYEILNILRGENQ